MANYSRGNSKQIIVGAAALFVSTGGLLDEDTLPALVADEPYRETLSAVTGTPEVAVHPVRNVGYTMNGLEIQFQPDFGEVQVDQVLDVAKLFKQGMQVNLNTAFAEASLENLLIAVAGNDTDLAVAADGVFEDQNVFNMSAGTIGECPVERSLIAIGPGTGDCEEGSSIERIYVAYRALSIESVTVSAKRDEASMFEVSFRLLPDDATGSYGKIVDRVL